MEQAGQIRAGQIGASVLSQTGSGESHRFAVHLSGIRPGRIGEQNLLVLGDRHGLSGVVPSYGAAQGLTYRADGNKGLACGICERRQFHDLAVEDDRAALQHRQVTGIFVGKDQDLGEFALGIGPS